MEGQPHSPQDTWRSYRDQSEAVHVGASVDRTGCFVHRKLDPDLEGIIVLGSLPGRVSSVAGSVVLLGAPLPPGVVLGVLWCLVR